LNVSIAASASRRRALISFGAAALIAMTPFLAPAAAVVRAQGGQDDLPTQAELTTALAPLTVSNYTAGPGKDGWDGTSDFDVNGVPDGKVHATVDISQLPTSEGAAGFLQTKLQQLRDDTRQLGLQGDLGPAGDQLTLDADEAYFGVWMTPQGATPPLLAAVQISRYEDEVIATTVLLQPNGPISDGAAQTLGIITGQLLKLMNSD